ncbi:MAG: nitroreductase family protein, partial [Paramuribaculum sp.]|nr:nitroreductase family protein [Paramuribaculum sp.]
MKDLDRIIAERRSVRSFDIHRQMTEKEAEILLSELARAESSFGGKVTIELKKFDLKGPFKPSTYGTINGASWYFLMGTDCSEASRLTLGFRMEQVVLKAASMGLGTCWIAGTFKGTTFANACAFPPDTPLKAVMPVGYPTEKMSLKERLMRAAVGSARRKPMADLFIVDPASKYYQLLEMMRLAPSSTNSQPWRALVDGDTIYFYYENKSAASILDLGIGLSHFYLAAKEQGIEGRLSICEEAPSHPKW